MATPGHTVVETDAYLADCAHLDVTEEERFEIVNAIAADPAGGDLIKGSGGARKVRVAARGRGKRGGYRLITAYVGQEAPVFLLALYAKNERADLSQAAVNALSRLISELKRKAKDRR